MFKLVVIASIGGFLFGYDTGIVAGAQLYFRDTWPDISDEQIELVVSIAQIGSAIASLLSGPLQDKIGRKPTIILSDILFTLGALVMAVAPTIEVLMVGRLLVGFGVGIASLVVPVYLSEVSPQEMRGAVVAVDIMLITSGQLISASISLVLGRNWRLMLGLAGVPSALQLLGMLAMPESQRWLARIGRKEPCHKVIKQIYDESRVESEFNSLTIEVENT